MENNTDSSDQRIHPQSKKTKTIDDAIKTLSGELPDLPQDVIAEILVRLPVKPLLKFKCVAKSWLYLISSPKFITTHVTCSTLDQTFASYRLMLGIFYDPALDDVKHGSVSSIVGDLLTDVVEDDDCPNDLTPLEIQITGSCNGLLCVSVDRGKINRIFLWNPCLRMSKKLPPLAAAETEKIWSATYGVGYDEPNDDYKVLGLFMYFPHGNYASGFECMVHIYNLKNDSWKMVEGFKGGVGSHSSVIYANGKFHFLAFFKLDDDHSGCNIMSLDLENEVYGTIEQPKYDNSDISIGVLKGCITALYSCELDHADVWVLKEYGVKKSWTKLVSIPYIDEPSSDYCYRLCFLLNGKYLVGRGSRLFVYDPRDNSFTYPCRQMRNIDMISSTGIYVESLVPLPS